MSDIQTLGAAVRQVIADLPAGEVQRASSTLVQSHVAITTALRQSVESGGAGDIARAADHLDKALRQLAVATDQLDRYLIDIGLTPNGGHNSDADTAPSTSAAGATAGSEDWWRQRVNEISEGDATTAPADVAITRLFSEMVDVAGAGDRDRYRQRLLEAGARNGPRLAGLSWPMLRGLTSDVLGRMPTRKDDDTLRATVRDPLRKVLPKLPEGVALSQLHGACSLPHDRGSAHPVDAAAAGPVMVAALLREREKTRKDT